MSEDNGRNLDGTFAPGNQASAKSGGAYGLEAQVYSGKLSTRLMSAVLKNFERLQNGEAGDMHDWLTALAYSVAEGFAGTLSHVKEESESGKREDTSVYRAERSLHSWAALAGRLLERRLQYPEGDDKTSARDVLEAIRGNDNEHE